MVEEVIEISYHFVIQLQYQALADVATDKLFTQIPSSEKGKIHKRYFQEEEACEVGQVLLEIEVEDEAGASSGHAEAAPTKAAETTKAAPQQTIQTSQTSKSSGSVDTSQILATPAVRALVREHKLDITSIKGTGKDGRIMKEDVLRRLSQGAEPTKPAKTEAPKAAGRTAAYLNFIRNRV